MKVLLLIAGLVLIFSNAATADKAIADALKPYEQFSPYKWTQWIESRPGNPIAAAAIAYNAPPLLTPESDEDSASISEEDDDEDDEFVDGPNAFENWFKRAILPIPEKKSKDKKVKDDTAAKKPSIVDVSPDFWGPPPTILPNITGPPPPGYWAAKKSMFVSKLFAALAASVLNSTGPPTDVVTTTTTVSPRQAILDELSEVLLSDFTRSVSPVEEVTQEPEDFSDESDESDSSEEEPTTVAPRKSTKSSSKTSSKSSSKSKPKIRPTTVASPTAEEIKPTTVNPFLLNQVEFLAKLTEAIAASTKSSGTAATPRVTKPANVIVAPPKEPMKASEKKAGKKSKKSSKKMAKTPSYWKYLPTTTTPSPKPAADYPEIDYDALARALLGSVQKKE